MRLNKKEKQEKAIKLLTLRNLLTPQQQLKKLDSKLGVGKGAKKERTRLNKLIAEEKKGGEKNE